jgi:endonuclease/exonuclease/phosphatase family metal-dependent hydrolase
MRHTIFLILWLLVPRDTLSVMCWNVENFFDWRNDSTTVSDAEFSSRGERHWTWKRFQAKANAFAKALFWVEAETGRLPDIVGLEEVENAFVLRQVLQKTALRKTDYKYVHYDTPDRRGIDVALLYRTSVLELVDSKPCHLYEADTVMATRDILLCVFRRKVDGAPPPFAVLVNHHPSKYGGALESEPKRRIAVDRLRFLADSLAAEGIDRIIAGGDFNDTPDNPVFLRLEPALKPLHTALFRRGEGTIKYDGKWALIDHFYASPALWDSGPSMRILRIPFLLTRDTAHSGDKPLRTYTGPRPTGGVSDHLPILLEISFTIENSL